MAKKVGFAKKFLGSLLSLMLAVSPVRVLAAQSGLVDPEVAACESEAALEGLKSPLDDGSKVAKTINTGFSHSGEGCVEVNAVMSSYLPLIAFVPTEKIEEGATYYFSVWYNDSNDVAGTANFEFVGRTEAGVPLASKKLTGPGGWKRYDCYFDASAAIAENVNYFYIRAYGMTGVIYFDDIMLKKIDKDEFYVNMVTPDIAECEGDSCLENMKTPLDDGTVIKNIATDIKRSGEGSVEVNATKASYLPLIAFKPIAKLETGESYYFSVWYNDVNNIAGNNNFEFVGRLPGGGKPVSSQKLTAGGGWNKYECRFSVAGDYADFAQNLSYFYIRSSGMSGKIYFDDITFRKVDPKEAYGRLIPVEIAECESSEALSEFNANNVNGTAESRSISADYAHSGNGSLRIVIPGTYKTYVGFKPEGVIKSGAQYYFSVWYYNPDNITGRMFLRFTSVTGNSISNWVTGVAYDSGAAMKPGGWNKYEFRFTATDKLENDLKYFYITTDSGENSTVYFDDINLRMVSDETVSLTGITPESGAQNVKLDSEIRLAFSGEADYTDIDVDMYINGEKQENRAFTCRADGDDIVIIPQGGLAPDTRYRLVINRVNDYFGNLAAENKTLEFSTGERVALEVKFTDSNGKALSAAAKGSVSVVIELTNNNGTAVDCMAIVMVCEGENVKKVYATPAMTLSADEHKTDIAPLSAELDDGNYIKVFLWTDDTDAPRALSKCVELR